MIILLEDFVNYLTCVMYVSCFKTCAVCELFKACAECEALRYMMCKLSKTGTFSKLIHTLCVPR